MLKQLHIGILTGRIPYPNGLASAQHIHLIARAMAEAGAAVNVWVDGLDAWTEERNDKVSGVKDGIPYEYLLGKTQASHRKWRRILDRFAMVLAACRMISRAIRNKGLNGLYFYTPCARFNFERLIVHYMSKKMG